MKKFFIVLICCSLLLCGCNSSKAYDFAVNNLAEVRYNLYATSTEDISVTLMSGKREKDYVVNGYCTDPIEFGVITFNVLADVVLPDVVNFVLTVGTTRYDGMLEKNPFDGSYVYDVKKIIDSGDVITAKIIAGDFVKDAELISVTKNFNVNWQNALKLACSELKNELNDFVEDGVFKGECYVKIINDDEVDDNFYWYVNFVNRSGKNYAVVIDPISHEIMAKKSV